ncbi:MAG: type II toxin-antitoxin system VapC family toxin [Cyanobacteria bacterium P01_D01_bin.36]
MRLLIDTHILLWFINNDPQLNQETKALLQSDTDVAVSIASLWEISIKVSIGKLTLPDSVENLFPQQLKLNQIDILPIKVTHLQAVSVLPFHHKDPFDRLIIAQALVEKIGLVSVDKVFEAYGVSIVESL